MSEVLSYIFSIISIIFYVVVYLPEFTLILKQKSSDGLSPWLIILWNQGDILSLLGTILLQLNLSLILIGLFHYVVGVCMVITVMIYNPDKNKYQTFGIMIFLLVNLLALVLTAVFVDEMYIVPGEIIGWLATSIYILGRLPQMYMNYKRKSTKGLSMLMYIFCMLGNFFYFMSIITFSMEWEYIRLNTPWIILVFGLILLDFVVLIQSIMYKKNSEANHNNTDTDSNVNNV